MKHESKFADAILRKAYQNAEASDLEPSDRIVIVLVEKFQELSEQISSINGKRFNGARKLGPPVLAGGGGAVVILELIKAVIA